MPLVQDKKYTALKAKFATKLASTLVDVDTDPDTLFEKVANLDPTASSQGEKHRYLYLEWICSRMIRNPPREQDFYKITEDLSFYASLARLDKYRQSRPGTIYYAPYVKPRLDEYSTLNALSETLLPHQNLKDRKKAVITLDNERQQAERESLIIYDGPEGKIIVPQTKASAQFWGKNTKWCISATKDANLFDQYYKKGTFPILMFLPRGTPEKFAFNEYDRTAARNMVDVPIYKVGRTEDIDEERIKTLGNFLTAALRSGSFSLSSIEDPHLIRSFQKFALRNPPVYAQILIDVTVEQIPDFLQPKKIMAFAQSYAETIDNSGKIHNSDEDETSINIDDAELRHETIQGFMSDKTVVEHIIAQPQGLEKILDLVKNRGQGQASSETARLLAEAIILSPTTASLTREACLADIQDKFAKLIQITQELGIELIQDQLSLSYLKTIPAEYWQDEEFSATAIQSVLAHPEKVFEVIPEMFEHPQTWIQSLRITDIDNDMYKQMATPRFQHIWISSVEGKPFLEVVANSPGAGDYNVVSDISSANKLYDLVKNIENINFSPLVKRIEQLYPDGFDNEVDIHMACEMTRCDFTALLETSVSRNPELFADIYAENQTEKMVEIGIKHDPEALADVAARFFKKPDRTPELAKAFQRMVNMKSPYVAAVAEHFPHLAP